MSENLIAVFGGFLLLVIAFLFSTNKRKIRLRVVAAALGLQIAIGVLVLYLPGGRAVLAALSAAVNDLLGFAGAGIDMVFGPLVSDAVGFSFALNVLPVIIFFASLMAVLYHIGVMQWVVRVVGISLHALLATGRVASLNAAANIFVGQTEAPLIVRP
ncbi:MAG: Na+ dependent nucleoside transporter N-terminal domain-containing protein, partial [Oceanicaulis sp.]